MLREVNLDELLLAAQEASSGPQYRWAWARFGQALDAELTHFFARRFDHEVTRTLVQQTVVVVIEKLASYERRADDSLTHYVTSIAANKAKSLTSKRKREREGLEYYARMLCVLPDPTPSSWVLSERERELFHEYKDELPEHLRRVIEHDLAGVGDDRAFAEAHGMALNTVRTHRRRAKECLRQIHEARRKTPMSARDTPSPRS